MLAQKLIGAASPLVAPYTYISRTDQTYDSLTSFVVNAPSGAVSGDVLLIFISMSSGRRILSVPSGFTLVAGAGPTGDVSSNVRGYYFRGTFSGQSTFTFLPSGSASAAVSMLCYRPSGTPASSAAAFSTTTQSGTTMTAPTIIAPSASLLFRAYFADANTIAAMPSGYELTYQVVNSTSPKTLGIAAKVVPAGATGTETATLSSSAGWNAASYLLS